MRLLLLLGFLPAIGCGRQPPGEGAINDLFAACAETRAGVDPRWRRAQAEREFSFPADHGAHKEFRVEWWYYTGNVRATDGRRLGYQLTFFRIGVAYKPAGESRWAVRDIYTAHFAVSDLEARRHRFAQQNRRAGVGAAGAAAGRLAVWNGSWRAEVIGEKHHLAAQADRFGIELTLSPTKGPILHGRGGLSQKGPAEGNASYYYSMPRMKTTGTVTIDGQRLEVHGESWMDHEFSTSFLEKGQRGWDWFSLQMDNGSELMLYQMRREDGGVDPYSSGTFIAADGAVTRLTRDDFTLTPNGGLWRSPKTGAEYPIRWRIAVPKIGARLQVRAPFGGQEMRTNATTGIAYWEGSVEARGELGGEPATGVGYLELTGYAGVGLGSLLE